MLALLQLLLLSRLCVGFGLAGAPVAFTLLMELLPASSRALWGVLIELAWTVGTIGEAALAWTVLNTQGWRLLLLLSTTPLMLLLVLVRWLPESPRWLLAQGDVAGAAAALQQVAQMNGRTVPSLSYPTAAATPADTNSLPMAAPAPAAAPGGWRSRAPPPPLQVSSSLERDPSSEEAAPLLSSRSTDSSSPSTSNTSTHRHSQEVYDLDMTPSSERPSCSQTPESTVDFQLHTSTPQQRLLQAQQFSPQAQDHAYTGSSTEALPSRGIQVLLAEVQHAFSMLWGGPHATTTNLLVLSWAAVALAYYGLVQLDGQLHIQAAAGAAAGSGSSSCLC